MPQISFSTIRQAQHHWAATAVAMRLRVLSRLRAIIADRAAEFTDSVQLPGRRTSAETLPMEVIPLLDAIRFLERNAERLLRHRHHGMAERPLWLWGVSAVVERAPLGIVLVIGPFNYPLFLPGVQVLQALAAGNAVVVKPSAGHAAPMQLLAACLKQAGLPDDLMTVTETDVAAVEHAFAEGIDKVILTGSAQTGNAIMHMAADHAVPCIMELSGNDAVLVHRDCDISLAVKALAYGLRLNGGATCIAPRRVFVAAEIFQEVVDRLRPLAARMLPMPVLPQTMVQVSRLLDEARDGGTIVHGGAGSNNLMSPALVINPPPKSGLLDADLFAPVMSLMRVASMDEAVRLAETSRFCLSATILAPESAARRLARQLSAGMIVINDIIVPTADCRLPFEANGFSGYGPTRGGDGLLAMTRSVSRITRRGRLRPHLQGPVETEHAPFFLAYIALAYGKPGGGLLKRIKEFAGEAVRMARRKAEP